MATISDIESTIIADDTRYRSRKFILIAALMGIATITWLMNGKLGLPLVTSEQWFEWVRWLVFGYLGVNVLEPTLNKLTFSSK